MQRDGLCKEFEAGCSLSLVSALTPPPLVSLQLALLQEEWRGRSLSSQLMTGAELEESSTTDGFQHPRIRSELTQPPITFSTITINPLRPTIPSLLEYIFAFLHACLRKYNPYIPTFNDI